MRKKVDLLLATAEKLASEHEEAGHGKVGDIRQWHHATAAALRALSERVKAAEAKGGEA